MPLQINIRHVEEKESVCRVSCRSSELDLGDTDELVHAAPPLRYDLTAHMVGDAILVQGRLELTLDCECARCLKPFQHRL